MAVARKNISIGIPIFFPLVRFSLRIGEWRGLFHTEEYKLIITMALNYCVSYKNEKFHDGFEVDIVGYLIDEHNIYLLVIIDPNRIGKMLCFFCDRIRDEIRTGLRNSGRHYKIKNISKETAGFTDDDLFKKHPFDNCLLEKLITGQKIHLKYYSPHVALMEKRVRDNNFSSAIDYKDGEGPVMVTKLELENHCYDSPPGEEDLLPLEKKLKKKK